MPSAVDVARYILALGRASDEDGQENDPISNLKLQKLLYYAQGFHLALYDETLFPERIQAWDHGPVVPEVYRHFKCYGSEPIPDEHMDPSTLDDQSKKLIEEVYASYGQFTAWRLRQMTHDEPPWCQTYKKGVQNIEIPPPLLAKYFKTQLSD